MPPEIVRRLIGGHWRTVEADASSNGGAAYVPGTDEICVTITDVPYSGSEIDWSQGSPFITQIGTAITTSGANIVMQEDGLYDVQVHLTRALHKGTIIAGTWLQLTAGARAADGDDNFCEGTADGNPIYRRTSVSFRWTLAAGDHVHAAVNSPDDGVDNTYIYSAVCQVVRLSAIPLPEGA